MQRQEIGGIGFGAYSHEAFRVTAAFMSVRLAKGGFIGRRFEPGRTN